MSEKKFENFSFTPKRPDTAPTIDEEGVVSGEIGRVEPIEERSDAGLERFRLIEREAGKDAQLAEIFVAAGGADSGERASLVLDRINAMRRELAASDVDPAFKRDRAKWLSDIANRLRELL